MTSQWYDHRLGQPLRNQRVCECCDQSAVLHVFECPAFNELRATFDDVIDPVPDNNLDAYMLSTNNHGNNAYKWCHLAEYITKYYHMRDERMARTDPLPVYLT